MTHLRGQSNYYMESLSILINCYGDYPEYSLRAVRSVVNNSRIIPQLHVGCCDCGSDTIHALRESYDRGEITTLIESSQNINKDPMMRLLIERTQTEYFIWMDDDSHVLAGWDDAFRKFMSQRFDVAGEICLIQRDDEYQRFMESRVWYTGINFDDKQVIFPTGGFWAARTEFVRKHGFPDREMVKKQDDMLLGDLVIQQKATMVMLSQDVLDRIKISDGDRRGTGEGEDGWHANPSD